MTYAVGDTGPSGGFIFFVDSDGSFADFDYLEAAPAGWSGTATDPQVDLCAALDPRPEVLTEWSAHALGAGASNTATLAADGCAGSVAAVRDLEIVVAGATYDDWYVPSIGELLLMIETARAFGAGSFSVQSYMSSTFSGTTTYRSYDPSNLSTGQTGNSDSPRLLRPVRRFSEAAS